LKGIKGSKKGESRYKKMNGKAVLQLPEQRIDGSHEKCSAKD
jgi:hypothetical protein